MRHPEICLQTLDATPWVISRIAIASCMTSQDTEMNKHDAWIFLGNLKDSKSHGKLPIEFHDFPIKTLHLYRGYSHVFSCFAHHRLHWLRFRYQALLHSHLISHHPFAPCCSRRRLCIWNLGDSWKATRCQSPGKKCGKPSNEPKFFEVSFQTKM